MPAQLIALSRPKQWIKQIFLILPIMSMVNEVNLLDILNLIISTVAFSLIAISVYTNNDIFDAPFDRKDSAKKSRPIASGKVTKKKARVYQASCFLFGLSLFFLIPNSVKCIITALIYTCLNYVYSRFRLKNRGTLGILIVGLGFPIRFLIGSWTLEIAISYWGLVLILQLSLFLLAGKRFQTVKRQYKDSKDIENASPDTMFWQTTLIVLSCLLLTTYSGFISQDNIQNRWGSSTLLISSIFIGMGILRYLEIVMKSKKYEIEDSTETILKDFLIYIYTTAYVAIMVFGRHLNG